MYSYSYTVRITSYVFAWFPGYSSGDRFAAERPNLEGGGME